MKLGGRLLPVKSGPALKIPNALLKPFVLDFLRPSPYSLKARQIAKELSAQLGCPLDKRSLNPVLYELQREGLTTRDEEFRWSAVIDFSPHRRSHAEVPADPSPSPAVGETPSEDREDAAAEAQVGHWLFSLSRPTNSHREVWELRCTLCGFETRYAMRYEPYVLPLTGKLRDRRRNHDRERHRESLADQARAERKLLGR